MPFMVKVQTTDGEEYVQSELLFLVEELPSADKRHGMRVVVTHPSYTSSQWWGATICSMPQHEALAGNEDDENIALQYDDGDTATQQLGQVFAAVELNVVPASGTNVFRVKRSYNHNGHGPFIEYTRTLTLDSEPSPEHTSSHREEPEPDLLEPEPELLPDEDSAELRSLLAMGFSRLAGRRALEESNNNVAVAASLLADIGDTILCQPLLEGVYHVPNSFAALMIKPAIISRVVEALYAFSLRVDASLFDERVVGVLSRLLTVVSQQADDLLSPLPQRGDPLGVQSLAIIDGQMKASSTWSYGRKRRMLFCASLICSSVCSFK